jgi:hypothetical protein
MKLRSWFREPLVQFLLLGATLFLFFEWRGGGSGPESRRIVIRQGQIQHLAAGFTRTWQRPPSERELKGLIDDYVREEMAYREAVAMGLERDDTIIRRRLRQKLEFLVEDAAAAEPPTDAELETWLDAHPDTFRAEPQVALRQVYLNPDRRGRAIAADAQRLLAELEAAGPAAPIAARGDSLMLPQEIDLAPRREVARLFGEGFADRILGLEPGRWQGPVESGYGLHLVLVRERREGRQPTLDEVRPLVERELLSERRKQRLEQMYENLLGRYSVTVERTEEAAAGATAAGAGGAPAAGAGGQTGVPADPAEAPAAGSGR